MVFQDGHAFVGLEGAYRIPMSSTISFTADAGHHWGVHLTDTDQQESSANDWGDRINNRPTEYNELTLMLAW